MMMLKMNWKFLVIGIFPFAFCRLNAEAINWTSEAAEGFVRLYEFQPFDSAACDADRERSDIRCSYKAEGHVKNFRVPLNPLFVSGWGEGELRSFTFTGNDAIGLFDKVSTQLWKEFSDTVTGSIFVPIVACGYDDASHRIGDCVEHYSLFRVKDQSERSQLFCVQRSEPQMDGGLDAAESRPRSIVFADRKVMSTVIRRQIASRDRLVRDTRCTVLE
jgi:hypothetical protein